jgi:hypothetical protein
VGVISRRRGTDPRTGKIAKHPDQSDGVSAETSAGGAGLSEPDNLALFTYRPPKTNDKMIKAAITKIDSIIVKAIIFVFFSLNFFIFYK